MKLTTKARVALCALLLPIALASCSNDDSDATAATDTTAAAAGATDGGSTTIAPESITAPPADVTAGLGKIVAVTARIAASVAAKDGNATAIVDEIEPIWLTIEGTVKANDADTYLAFEDNFAILTSAAKTDDAAKAAAASAAVAQTVTAYLAAHPG